MPQVSTPKSWVSAQPDKEDAPYGRVAIGRLIPRDGIRPLLLITKHNLVTKITSEISSNIGVIHTF